jgi:hypothetical protein
MMPILAYFAVVGSALVALLFVADATLDKHGPMPFNSEFSGLPKKWQPEAPSSILTATPAPAPDMTSEAVRAAAPPQAAALPAAAAAARAEAVAVAPAKVEAPKKPKRIVRKQPRPHDWQNHAWSRNNDLSPFSGGSGFFGRF